MPTCLSLFSGGGGGDLGLERAGIMIVGHAEIDPFARSVLTYHNLFNDRPILGDVDMLSRGRKMKRWMQARFAGVDLVHCSSPCQDLSVAGKRAGMKGLRSSLFFRSVRIWKFLGAKHFLWENVPGALSSHKGEDFAQVLSAMVGGPVAVPRVGTRARWPNAGVVAGPDGVACWRILDLRHFGPPQRRRRLFVFGARAGGVDPAEVLLERESVRGDSPARGGTRQSAARGTQKRAGTTIDPAVDSLPLPLAFNWQNGGGYGDANDGLAITEDATGPLDKSQIKAVVAFDTTQVTHPENRSNPQPGDPCHPLAASAHVPLIFKPSHFTRGKDGAPSDVTPPLSHDADKGDQDMLVHQPVSGTISGSGAGTARPGNARNETDMIVAPTINGHQRQQVDGGMVSMAGIPRRLMPIECERLMGWPDDFTRYGIVETGKRAGEVTELSDAARYRICGNGEGAPVLHWIGKRFVALLTEEDA